MFKKIALLTSLTCCILMVGCDSDESKPPPLELSYTQANSSVFHLRFTAVADQVRVNSYTVNRGNCAYSDFLDDFYTSHRTRPPGKPPFNLKFGQSEEAAIRCNNLREVLVETDKGTYTFTF